MKHLLRHLGAALALFLTSAVQAQATTYEPVALAWTASEVENASMGSMQTLTDRAAQQQKMGCKQHCERLVRIFNRLLITAREEYEAARQRPWSLTVVRLHDVEAMALPGGQVIISEHFINERRLSDAALAFVLAHEMAHSILEHERQMLSFARMLLPRHVPRSVPDMYTEMEFNFKLRKAIEPVMQQGEFEADELGLLLAAKSGYAAEQQLAFMASEVSQSTGSPVVMATHPSAQARLEKLRERLPLALRLEAMR